MFQPFLEKENASQLRVLEPVHSRVHATPAKIFQGNTSNIHAPLRKALGDRNSQFFKTPQRTALKPVTNTPALTTIKSNQLLPAKPVSKQNWKQSHVEKPPKRVAEPKPEIKQKTKEENDWEEIEFAPPLPEVEDDFEDIWPRAERIESFLDLLHTWRPRKFAPMFEEPFSDSDDFAMVDLDDSIEDVKFEGPEVSDWSVEEHLKPPFEAEPEVNLEYVPLPPLDYSFESLDV